MQEGVKLFISFLAFMGYRYGIIYPEKFQLMYHTLTNVVSHIVSTFIISLAITVCMCSSRLIVYSHVPLLERYALQRYYVIHVVFIYNAFILVLSQYTTKGKYQGGENLLFHIHPWVYSKYTDYG